jgi:hypothetical protein
MNLRKQSTLEEFERALAECKREDFDGTLNFTDLLPNNGLSGYARRRNSFMSLRQSAPGCHRARASRDLMRIVPRSFSL